VAAEQPRSGIAHDLAHPLPQLGPVAVNGAPIAGGFVLAVRAALETAPGILVEIQARRARRLLHHVMIPAKELDHQRHSAPLTPEATAEGGHAENDTRSLEHPFIL